MTHAGWRRLVVGVEDGPRPYISFDNAASTPPFTAVLAAIERFAPCYSNVHRGTGYKAAASSDAFEAARARVVQFIGADPERDVVLFTRNTTDSLNHLAARLRLPPGAVVLTTLMEHHSNDLPWRRVARVEHVDVRADGTLDEDDLRARLARHAGRVALLAVSGASNVTGVVNPIHTYARWAHEAGARIVVDAAQLAPHRPIVMRPADPDASLDFVAFSAHKMYAPFGVGVLAGPRDAFADGEPCQVGGGTIAMVSLDRVAWAELPDREEAGTPCIMGAVALGAAIAQYEALDWTHIQLHECALTRHALNRLGSIPGLTVYGPERGADRLGVIAFNLHDRPHDTVATNLADQWGIGTRSGCFCAHPYVKALLGIAGERARRLEDEMAAGRRAGVPGAVRVSFGLYNTAAEVDHLGDALEAIAR